MSQMKPIYKSSLGGSIDCLQGITGRIFKTCLENKCFYSKNLHSAKAHLNSLENGKHLLKPFIEKINPPQIKTTLKWNSDGDLSSIDMTRVLNLLGKPSLLECELSCEIDS